MCELHDELVCCSEIALRGWSLVPGEGSAEILAFLFVHFLCFVFSFPPPNSIDICVKLKKNNNNNNNK